MNQRHPRKAPATFALTICVGATAPFPCWPTAFGLVLHRQVQRGGPPWRIDREDSWVVSDPVTGHNVICYRRTPREALQALHHRLRLNRRRSGRSYAAIVAAARHAIVHGVDDGMG